MIEILSPDQSQTRITKNILHCLNHGTQIGWLIDLAEQTVLVFLPKAQPDVFDEPERIITVPSFAHEISLSVATVFDWLLD